MRYSLIIAAAAAVAALSSCTTISNTATTVTPETMIVNMTVADLDVSPQQVTATVSYKWNPFKKLATKEKAAEQKALRETGADVLVEPVYEIKKGGLFKGGSVTVTGHPATFVNFRPMTLRDAEVITTLKNKVAFAAPAIPTSGPTFIDRLRPAKQPKAPKLVSEDNKARYFLSALYSFPSSSDVHDAWSVGLMFGRYRTWGWYTKLTFDSGVVHDEYYHERGYEEDHDAGFTLTGGAIRKLPQNFAVFAGLGVGKNIPSDFEIPVEVGAQWNYKKLNVLAGFQYTISCGDYAGLCKPFIGVGINF